MDRYTYSGNDRVPVITLREALKRRGFPIENLQADDYIVKRADEIFVACKDEWTAFLNPGGQPWCFCSGAELFSLAECRPEPGRTDYYWVSNTSYAVSVEAKKDWPDVVFKLVMPC